MAWEQLSINRPHLVYILLGAFTSLFMLCSSVIKERLYIGEATVATIFGIIFGPHAANLIDPRDWGNVDQITLEFSRIVLVVQCFAVGVELPKAYMERHWKSVTLLLVPVMTFGWLITSLFIWGLVPTLNWLDSLTVAACVTATDPVLASSVVGKGKFAKRVPRHLRDLLSAESGCNDGMAFPFVYLALYLIKYRPHANEVSFHWFCFTILYECIFGAFFGFMVGYFARRAIRYAHEHDIIDRESFLVFYFVLALFCAGSGSLLGLDDLLVGFACGVGFSNDGWFTEKTEESHVSNVIDLLINLSFFVYFGTIIPWAQFNSDVLGLSPWRLVVIGILVLFFRRIPIMLALKPIIPDVKTWREALFAGHFGPIGVGAIFIAILARAELETDTTTPLAEIPPADFPHANIIELIWPITTFLVICSILVHGSSIAVFTLGKHINTFTLTMSYTTQNDPTWLDRLPRIQSRSKSSMSLRRPDDLDWDEKAEQPGENLPRDFLRRQREGEQSGASNGRAHRRHASRSRSNDSFGGPITQSAIGPMPRTRQKEQRPNASDSDTLAIASEETSPHASTDMGKDVRARAPRDDENAGGEIYEEGQETIYEDAQGNVLEVERTESQDPEERQRHEQQEAQRLMRAASAEAAAADGGSVPPTSRREESPAAAGPDEAVTEAESSRWRRTLKRMGTGGSRMEDLTAGDSDEKKRKVPARAYQFGNTVVIEDEDGEVIRKFEIKRPAGPDSSKSRSRVQQMGAYLGLRQRNATDLSNDNTPESPADGPTKDSRKGKDKEQGDSTEDEKLRFTLSAGGKRMNVVEFMDELKNMDPKSRAKFVEQSDAPEEVKREARADAESEVAGQASRRPKVKLTPSSPTHATTKDDDDGDEVMAEIKKVPSNESARRGPDGLTLVDSNNLNIPFYDVTRDLQPLSKPETAAQRRRREAALRVKQQAEEDSEDDGTPRVPPASRSGSHTHAASPRLGLRRDDDVEEETAAERRRREDALGISHTTDSGDEDDDIEDDDEETSPERAAPRPPSPVKPRPSVRYGGRADSERETAAEARRREAAVGDQQADGEPEPREGTTGQTSELPQSPGLGVARPTGIRFADQVSRSGGETNDTASRNRRSRGFFNL